MKLTKTQEELINEIKNEIDRARALTFKEWLYASERHDLDTITDEKYINRMKKYCDGIKNGFVLTIASSSTLKALEKKGYIEIIIDAGSGVDHVKLLNY